MDYTATLTLSTPTGPDELVDHLIDFHPAVSSSPLHPDSWQATITYPATDLPQAITTAQALAASQGTLRGLEAVPTTDWDHREDQPAADLELLSVTQAAERLGVTPQAVRERLAHGTLPGIKAGNTWVVPASAIRA